MDDPHEAVEEGADEAEAAEDEEDGLWEEEGGEEAVEAGRVRLVLLRECERRGRKLLFDSRWNLERQLIGMGILFVLRSP